MIHGMVGMVEKRDALTREWYFGFVVNACKVPFANDFSCLQYYDNEEEYGKAVRCLRENAKIWNCVDFRPRNEEVSQDNVKNAGEHQQCLEKEEPKNDKKPIQLSLFD